MFPEGKIEYFYRSYNKKKKKIVHVSVLYENDDLLMTFKLKESFWVT